jgi:hypothetical protein
MNQVFPEWIKSPGVKTTTSDYKVPDPIKAAIKHAVEKAAVLCEQIGDASNSYTKQDVARECAEKIRRMVETL